MASMYVDVQPKTWAELLPYVTFAYNTATQETTRFTPFYLVYGHDLQTMLEAMLPCHNINHLDLRQDTELFAQRAVEARELARANLKKQQSIDARRYYLRHRQVEFQPGDQVLPPYSEMHLNLKLLLD